MSKEFTHLHHHGEFSLLDGLGKVKDVVANAKRIGQTSLAITDHGTCGGHYNFHKYTQIEGIKPIFGCEVYIVGDRTRKGLTDEEKEEITKDIPEKEQKKAIRAKEKELKIRSSNHLILLAKNDIGLVNLYKIVSDANINGYYYRARTDYKFVMENKEGLIVLSACLAGLISQSILGKEYEYSIDLMKRFQEEFKDDFYLEIQPNKLPEQKIVNTFLIKQAKQLGIKFVATNDNHYILKEDKAVHDTLLLIKQKRTMEDIEKVKNEVDDESGEETVKRDKTLLFSVDDLYMKTYDEMFDSFKSHGHDISDNDIKTALDNTQEVVEKCTAKLDFTKPCFPATKIPANDMPHVMELLKNHDLEDTEKNRNLSHFRYLINEGWKERIFDKVPDDKIEEYEKRLKYEFEVITSRGYTEYFLVVTEFIRWGKNKGILIGPGRGSACGSLIAYLIKITDIDPIPFGLYFERFLNPQRCLHPLMKVKTPNGKRNIIDIEIGDEVLALSKKFRKVKNKFIKYVDDDLLKIKYKGGYKLCTNIHKMDIVRNDKTIEIIASELQMTDKLIGETSLISIDEIEKDYYNGEVIDIEVEDEHNFYVSDNDVFVLTHNSKMPDIDTDFPDDNRETVRQHIINEYGEYNVAQVVAYSTMSINSCFRDVARVHGLPLAKTNEIAKQLVVQGDAYKSYMTIEENLEQVSGLKDYCNDPEHGTLIKRCFDMVSRLQHQVRHASIAAAASVITEKEIYNYTTIRRTKYGLAIEWDGTMIAKTNILKMDILGIRCLTIIKDALNMLEKKGIKVDLYDLKLLEDKETIELFKNGDTLASFQFDSHGIRKMLKDIKPTSFEDIIAAAALYRPGPLSSGLVETFWKRKNGTYKPTAEDEKNKVFLDLFEPFLKETYGVIVYQEQLIYIFNKVFGLDMGDADLLRRAIDEKNPKLINPYIEKIKSGTLKSQITDGKILNDALAYIQKISGYSFNKCIHKNSLIYDLTNKRKITIEQAYNEKDKVKETFSADTQNKYHPIIPHKIKDIHKTGKKKLYRITLESGKQIITSAEHTFFINGKLEERTLKDLKVGMHIAVPKNEIKLCQCGCGQFTPLKYAHKYNLHFNKLVPWNKGKTKKDNEILARMARNRIGNTWWAKDGKPWNKGKTKENDLRVKGVSDKMSGKPFSAEHKENLRKSSLKRKVHGHTGKPHSEATKQNFRKIIAKRYQDGIYKHQFSGLHKIFKELMKKYKIDNGFISEYNLKYYSIDEANPKLKIAVEIDGDFFHANPKFFDRTKLRKMQQINLANDKRKETYLKNRNWTLLRFWEYDIRNKPDKCMKILKRVIEVANETF